MQKEEHKESVDSFVCPSFSAYSSNKLDHIADQLTQNDHRFNSNDSDDNFEFVSFSKLADGVFFDSSPAFPIFNRDLETPPEDDRSDAAAIQITLGKLLIDESLSPSSSSEASSEVEDELEAIPPGTYCVWTPKPAAPLPNRCKKSKSTGSSSSKRWKLLDLLRRSNSEGKESLVFLTPSSSSSSSSSALGLNSRKKKGENSKEEECGGAVAGKKIPAREKKVPAVSAHEALYVRNREKRRVDKRRSYLPYRQDLVGFFVNLNAMGKSFPLQF